MNFDSIPTQTNLINTDWILSPTGSIGQLTSNIYLTDIGDSADVYINKDGANKLDLKGPLSSPLKVDSVKTDVANSIAYYLQ